MDNFFDSEIVKEELEEINDLQKNLYGSIMLFPEMDRSEKVEHIELLTELLDKQKVMYARLSLSDDPEAKAMKDNIMKGAAALGLPPDVDMSVVFGNMEKMLAQMKSQVE